MDFSNNKIYKFKYTSKKEIFMKFLFLQYPIKIMRHIVFILVLSALIALAIILSYISIPIVNTGIKLSFTWLPTIVAGWFFGPVVGLVMGATIDTITFLMHGGIWFWLYAIQEPMVGLISGIIAYLNYRISLTKKPFKYSFILTQIVFNLFSLFLILFFLLVFIYQYDLLNKKQGTDLTTKTLMIVLGCLIFCFYIMIQTICIIKYKRKSNYKFFYMILISCLITTIFSFILGPVSAVEYLIYINHKTPNSYIKYGYLFYLIPRVVKECFKTPVYIYLLWGVCNAIEASMKRTISQINNSWKV